MGLPAWAIESWVEFAIAVITIFIRIIARTRAVGWGHWQGDDYLVIAMLFFLNLTLVAFFMNHVYPTNQRLTDEIANKMTPHEIDRMRVGSIWNFVGWAAYMSLVWSCKGCMLFLYSRLTIGLWQKKLVKFSSYLVVITYFSNWLAMLLKCRPITRNWQIVPAPGFCVMGLTNMYAIGTTNLFTDLLIFFIPLPLIVKVSLPLKKKILIFLVLCSGVFIIVATTIRMVFTILTITGKLPDDLGFMLGWATRENFTSVMIVNVPIIFTALRRTMAKDPSSGINRSRRESHSRSNARANERRATKATLEISRQVSFDVDVEDAESCPSENGGNGMGTNGGSLRMKTYYTRTEVRKVRDDDFSESEVQLRNAP